MSNTDVPTGRFGQELIELIHKVTRFREYIGYDTNLMPAVMLGDVPFPPTDIDDAYAGYMKSNSPERVATFIEERHLNDIPVVCFVTDEVGTFSVTAEDAERYQADGAVEAAWENGDPNVVENLGWYAIDPDTRKTYYVTRRYRFLPSEGWSWEDPSLMAGDGAVPWDIELSLNQVIDGMAAAQ